MSKRNLLQLFLALLIGILLAVYSYSVYSNFERRWNYLTWDPAAHGWDGMRLALDLRRLDILQFLVDTNHLVLWPPLHSYLQIPYFFLFGFDYRASVLCSLTFLALFPVALTWLYQGMKPSWAGWAILMALTSSSPFFVGFSATPMLEIFGAVLTVWSAALFLKRSYWFPLSLALLFFLKYNYFAYLILGLLAAWFPFLSVPGLKPLLRPFKFFFLASGIFCVFAAVILLTGGFKVGSLSVRGVGNPAYVFFLVLLAGLLWKGRYKELWRSIRGTGWEWFVIPVLVWLVIPVPNRVKTIFSFAISRPLDSPSAYTSDYYLYYFEKISLYFSSDWTAWVVMIAGATIAFFYRRRSDVRFISGLFFLSFLLMTLNQNKQERYLFTFVPALWLLIAFGVSTIRIRIVRGIAAILIAAAILLPWQYGQIEGFIRMQFIPLISRAPLNFISTSIADADQIRVLGTTNEFNPAMIQYHSGLRSGFAIKQHFDWEIEKAPKDDLHIICIGCEPPGTLLKKRNFPGELRIQHSFLDTP